MFSTKGAWNGKPRWCDNRLFTRLTSHFVQTRDDEFIGCQLLRNAQKFAVIVDSQIIKVRAIDAIRRTVVGTDSMVFAAGKQMIQLGVNRRKDRSVISFSA